MQSTEMTSNADLVNAFTLMLQEAASRGSPQEAAYVISGVLKDLSKDHPQVKSLARNWSELANPSQAMMETV
ncbi:hypothetical protein GL272_19945 [Aeromonas veronii]|uniref:hypothetical protein n=1 Tax=Aeromonas TaxID=642 RepID=UPI000640A4F0|nr:MULTISPECIES: hypothetical protein [Aeromonas]ALZ82567.1 hypothetical protein AhyD4_23445 [Aeromonas hydrophila]MBW3762784.1 hypothetical protein [Aeromonas jandaei]MBW3779149.1 hypothetical protein [Aeromonas veronii]QGW99111.1 hypothetical protein FGM04_21445 [Aeromonas veronii]HDK8695634.1 hypothetical protein [Aeromonas hydrophila]